MTILPRLSDIATLPALLCTALLGLGVTASGQEEAPVDPESVERAQAHYAAVEAELRAADVTHLSAAQRAERAKVLDEFRRYRLAGDFAQDPEARSFRLPVFRDDHGRHCAVANLLHFSGEDALIGRVAGTNNEAWIAELADDAALAAWLEEVGLTAAEAARIQAPMGGVMPPMDITPGDMGPSSPGPTAPSSPGLAPLNPSPESPRARVPAPTTPGQVAPRALRPTTPDMILAEGVPTWWAWWEFNKLEWLRPNALHGKTRSGDRSSAESEIDVLRRIGAQLFEGELDHDSAQVRAAAVLAFARAKGPAAVPRILELLEDRQNEVRHAAILALAATRSEEGVHALLKLAADEDEVTPDARPVALSALAVARSLGHGAGVERMLPMVVLNHDDVDADYAAMFHQTLAASPDMAALARCRSQVVDHAPHAACDGRHRQSAKRNRFDTTPASGRALEALAADERVEEVLPMLLHQVGGRSLEHRRSAALALGDVEGALEPLMTAYELEREMLTRGFLALSIAEQGGEDARDFLIDQLEDGDRSLRPWNALALGVLAAEENDDTARAAIREGHGEEKNAENRGAYLLAMGISRDDAAREVVRVELASTSARNRMFAALALGLIGNAKDRPALASALALESSPAARSAMAQGLALFGQAEDSRVLLDAIADVKNPELQAQYAVALGFHGTLESLEGLLEALAKDEESDQARAAMIDAAGLLLSGQESLALGELSGDSNFTQFPAWMVAMLQTTL